MTALPHLEPRLADRLRHETGAAHRQFEATVGFDLHAPGLASAVTMLRHFHGVLRQLEPAMLALVPGELAAGRAKLDLLERDLKALGFSSEALATLPAPADMPLPTTEAEALGMLYVFEGSTLGGKVIVKALRRLPEWPIHGVSYFDPYGDRTGAMWQAFRAHLDTVPDADADQVVVAANRTFALLDAWMDTETAA